MKASDDTLESDISSDDDCDDDELMDEDEYSSEEDALIDDEDDADDEDDESDDDEPIISLPPDKDTYERRMRRISTWRDAVAGELPVSAPASPIVIPTVLDTCLSRKRKAECDSENAFGANAKRARISLLATCAACGWSFPAMATFEYHGSLANPNEACRAAVAYQLEA
ncbi:hypothetical protein EXIGLDRAFT_700364 [Exidia glandulosa HHB12029]|uniref:Uncharacterized protein n=1 Tax=Exidia glandulosa HHB12029 TaxID=1314781 RepID=A0A165M5R7_EXIGL|nr:hypothetical protein EXIGLDRAFT_700364 [Exidia glandulosa HHB12029]